VGHATKRIARIKPVSLQLFLLLIVVITALAFDFTNGFHDAGNAMAGSIGHRRAQAEGRGSPVRSAQRVVRHCAALMVARPGPVAPSEYTASRARLTHCMMWNGS
jgi:hypothetical protein